jgi:hypothetical protein
MFFSYPKPNVKDEKGTLTPKIFLVSLYCEIPIFFIPDLKKNLFPPTIFIEYSLPKLSDSLLLLGCKTSNEKISS